VVRCGGANVPFWEPGSSPRADGDSRLEGDTFLGARQISILEASTAMTQDFQSCAHLRATDPGDSPQTMLFRFLSARELNRRLRATFTPGLED